MLPNSYPALFNSVSDAISALEQQNYGLARTILIRAQQEAEELWISHPDAIQTEEP